MGILKNILNYFYSNPIENDGMENISRDFAKFKAENQRREERIKEQQIRKVKKEYSPIIPPLCEEKLNLDDSWISLNHYDSKAFPKWKDWVISERELKYQKEQLEIIDETSLVSETLKIQNAPPLLL